MRRGEDSRYSLEFPSDRFRNGSASPPSQHPRSPQESREHNGYHSEEERRVEGREHVFPEILRPRRNPRRSSTALPVPSPTRDNDEQASSRAQVPSPTRNNEEDRTRPPSYRRRVLSPTRVARVTSHVYRNPPPTLPSYAFRVPSPSRTNDSRELRVTSSPIIVPPAGTFRVPSPISKLTRDSQNPGRFPPPPLTPPPPYPQNLARHLSPPDAAVYSSPSSDQAQGLVCSQSARTPNLMSTSPPNSAGNHGFPGSAASIASSNLTYASYCRPHEADGALGKNTYHYQPLQDMQFRLVEIFPKRQTMIKCRIVHESLESPPPYLAISYTWGDINNTKMLEIGGSSLPVGVNLWGALWALRQKDASIFVWVDALCIDQSNRDEKAQQVPLMAMIYSNAEIVAIWLGTDEDDSARAIDFLDTLSTKGSSIEEFSNLVESEAGKSNIAAVVSLFERSYWTRLWVVQEILHAKDIMVYCGSKNVPWSVYTRASDIFSQYKRQIEYYFPGGQRDTRRHSLSLNQFSYSQVLAYEGPRSFLDLKSFLNSGDASLLKVLRACRSKLSSEPKDKLFGILGISAEARKDFPPDYNQSVKDVYTQIVDTLIETTDSLDVICDAIHFPIHTSSANLPSFVPDWSHIPQTSAMGQQYQFSASGGRKAICKFDDRLTKLTISAIYLDTIDKHGIAVGTLCTLADYLMAFLHWRALLLGETEDYKYEESLRVQEEFCSALSLGQIPKKYERPIEWLTACYHIFAAMLNKRLPRLLLDNDLEKYINAKVDIKPEDRRQFLQDHFGSRMMGRCFCRTKGGRIGMGSGVMLPGDIIVVPLGCSTPILLRKEGANGEYRFIGDVFVNRWMTGRAIDELNEKKRQVEEFVLH